MKKVRLGILGVGRGRSMMLYCSRNTNVELVAICDKWEEGLKIQKERHPNENITYYTDYDEFLKHDMDAVVLANYATEHAPFAIKALKAGKHVFSEVTPAQTLKEAIELIETVENSGKIYAYAENYCFIPAIQEMRKLYKEGKVGEIEYAECEYIHNCEPRWPELAYGDRNHWRNNLYVTYYCTHSLGPIVHITGLRPKSVIGFEGRKNARVLRVGRNSGQFGIEMVTLDNDAIVKSTHGELYVNSLWYSLYGSKGRMEVERETSGKSCCQYLYTDFDEEDGKYNIQKNFYEPKLEKSELTEGYGHCGSDFYSVYFFIKKILGEEGGQIIDVYEAMDMFLPGIFAYKSILNGGKSMDIPDLRKKEEREKWKNDTMCTSPLIAGDMLVPSFSLGNQKIDESIYEKQRKLREEWVKKNY